MIKINKFLGSIGRDQFKGLYLQCTLQISQIENAKYDIIDEAGNTIFTNKFSEEQLFEGQYENSHIIYLPIEKFKKYNTKFTLTVYGNTEYRSEILVLDTFKIHIGELDTEGTKNKVTGFIEKAVTSFNWYIDNFSEQSIYAAIEITDGKKTISEPDKLINPTGYEQQKISRVDISEFIKSTTDNQTKYLDYRIRMRQATNLDESKNFYEPKVGHFRFKYSRINETPNILLNHINLKKNGNTFQLSLDAVFHDSDLDDVKYSIMDNQGNTIFSQDYYTYTPSIENIMYNYKIDHFNSLFLKLNAQISDNLTFVNRKQFTEPLFSIKNLRIRRDRLYWDVTNYSSALIKTNVEILDMFNNIVYSGEMQTNRTEIESVTVTDDKPITLLQTAEIEYYKFRVRVECTEENYIDYVEFKNGTLVSTKHHSAPIVTDIQGFLNRDYENKKTISLNFKVSGTEGDLFKYKIYDDSGNDIFSTRDYISTPSDINITVPYDFVNRLITKIYIQVVNEYNKETTETIDLKSYYIRDLEVFEGRVLMFKVDNYCLEDIILTAEVYEHETDDNNNLVYNDTKFVRDSVLVVPNTIESVDKEMRFVPKVNGIGPFICRIKVECPTILDDRIVDYVPVPGYITPSVNNRPLIDVNVIKPTFTETELNVDINVSFTDIDADALKYIINDPYETIIKTDNFIPTGKSRSLNILTKKKYILNSLNTSILPLYIKCNDEEEAYDELYYKIPLHSINNINYLNGVFSWTYRLYTNVPIKMCLEVLDSEGYLYGKGEVKTGNYLPTLKTLSESINLDNYDNGTYRFRIKTYCDEENWISYYPNVQGQTFVISEDRSYCINDTSIKENKEEIREVFNSENYLTTLFNEKILKSDILTKISQIISKETNNSNKLKSIKYLLNLFSNHHDSKVYNMTDTNINNRRITNPYDNYAMSNSQNVAGNKISLPLKELDRLSFEKHHLRIYDKGKKVLDDNFLSKIRNDGLSSAIISEDLLSENCMLEIESLKNFVNDAEFFNTSIKIDSTDTITRLHNEGISLETNFKDTHAITCHIIRGTKRISSNRHILSRNGNTLNIKVLDSLYVGDILYITTNVLYERALTEISSERIQKGNISYLKPVYFIPFSFVTIDNNIVTHLNKAEVYINGYCATPIKDFTIVPANDKLNLPSIILFKSLLFENSKVEIFYRDTDMENSNLSMDVLNINNNNYAYYEAPIGSYPFIEGTFSVYQDNKKVPNDEYIILSDRHLAFRKFKWNGNVKEVAQNKNISDYHIKFNYPENQFIQALLLEYNKYKSSSYDITALFNALSSKDKETLLTKNDTVEYDSLKFINYVYEMENSEHLLWLKKLKDDKEYFITNGLDCSYNSFSETDILLDNVTLPYHFNHDINLSSSTALLHGNNIDDNLSIINPSRVLQVYDTVSRTKEIDCNANRNGEYDSFLNENIEMNMDYITSDIVFNCNKPYK